MSLDIQIDDIISFNTYGTTDIGNYSSVTVLGFSSGEALRNPQTAATRHSNIYSSLPIVGGVSTPN
jgi:hypothetical protein